MYSEGGQHCFGATTRDAVAVFLSDRGYQVLEDQRKVAGTATEQFGDCKLLRMVTALKMRVRACAGEEGGEALVSEKCTQPRGFVHGSEMMTGRARCDSSWIATGSTATRTTSSSRDGAAIVYAALIPRDAHADLVTPARSQRRLASARLDARYHQESRYGGSSPTIWLQDDRTPDAHEVADVLWAWPGVVDLVKFESRTLDVLDDTFDDCLGIDYSMLGSDGAARRPVIRSEVRRDQRVRRAVLDRTTGCERQGCGEQRDYPGFLDAPRTRRVENSDRIWNCVALCPNCHREAHFAPDADDLNAKLLKHAEQFRSAA
ncbi:MAG: HNH endonuclease [Rhodoferax sp.]|nr:HNH endonuclease [Rhodoferax sp.]